MNEDELRHEWDSVARALMRTIGRAQALPDREQNSQFNEELQYALCHAYKMCRVDDSSIDDEQLSYGWASIAKDLDRVIKRTKRLVEGKEGSYFSENLYDAFWHADGRAGALIEEPV